MATASMMPDRSCVPKKIIYADPTMLALLTLTSWFLADLSGRLDQVHQKGMTFDAFFAELAEGIPPSLPATRR